MARAQAVREQLTSQKKYEEVTKSHLLVSQTPIVLECEGLINTIRICGQKRVNPLLITAVAAQAQTYAEKVELELFAKVYALKALASPRKLKSAAILFYIRSTYASAQFHFPTDQLVQVLKGGASHIPSAGAGI